MCRYELHAKARVNGLHGGDAVFLAVSAHNEAGNANDSADAPALFCLPSPPPPPINLAVKAVTATSVVLGWDAPAHDHGSVITQYRVTQVLPNGAHKSSDVPSTRSAFDFSGLKPGEFVRSVQVQSGNIAGFGTPSERFILRTLAMPASPPLHLRLVRAHANGNNCSATIAWDAPSFTNGSNSLRYSRLLKKTSSIYYYSGAPVDAFALVFQRLKRDVTRVAMALPAALVLPDVDTPLQCGRQLVYEGPHGTVAAADDALPQALVGSMVTSLPLTTTPFLCIKHRVCAGTARWKRGQRFDSFSGIGVERGGQEQLPSDNIRLCGRRMDHQLRLQGPQRCRMVAAVQRGAGGEDPGTCALVRRTRKG